MIAKTHTIDGTPMTMREIYEAVPGIAKETLRSRVARGISTLAELKLGPKPGRNSPWRTTRACAPAYQR